MQGLKQPQLPEISQDSLFSAPWPITPQECPEKKHEKVAGGLDRSAPQSRKEQLLIASFSHLSHNCSKLLQSSWLLSSIWSQGPQDILQNRKGLQKAPGSTSLPAFAPFLAGREAPQTCLADQDGRTQLHLLLLPANLTKNLLRGVHWGWIFQDWLPLRAFLQYSSLGYQEKVTHLMPHIWIYRRERLRMHSPTCTCSLQH